MRDESAEVHSAWRRGVVHAASLLGPLLALTAVTLFFAVADRVFADGTFATWLNLRTVTVQTCVVAVAALGMTIIIISGGIDLSAGASLALCATTLAWGLHEDLAYLVRHGDNFRRATVRFEEAQKRVEEARRKRTTSDLPSDQLDANLADARRRLQTVLEAKRAAAVQRGDQGEFARTVKQLDGKLARLAAGQPLRSDPQWALGVPNSAWSAPLSVLLGISTGVLAGLVNGLLISGLRIAPFVVTLGSMTIFLGVGNQISDNSTIRPQAAQTPSWLADLDGNTPAALWGGFPTGVWLAAVLAILAALVLRYSVFGRHTFAIGSNESTARLCGVQVGPTKAAIYALGGLLFGIAGVYQFARLSSGTPMSGVGLELEIIAAVVIGGGSLNGGRGSVLGTLAGAAITAVIRSGCTQLELGDPLQRMLLGVIIICAVVIDQFRQRRMTAGA
ncbi:MAG: ABC transporter permease [Pirellulales bacterium]